MLYLTGLMCLILAFFNMDYFLYFFIAFVLFYFTENIVDAITTSKEKCEKIKAYTELLKNGIDIKNKEDELE